MQTAEIKHWSTVENRCDTGRSMALPVCMPDARQMDCTKQMIVHLPNVLRNGEKRPQKPTRLALPILDTVAAAWGSYACHATQKSLLTVTITILVPGASHAYYTSTTMTTNTWSNVCTLRLAT
jgi:hypothetical protein